MEGPRPLTGSVKWVQAIKTSTKTDRAQEKTVKKK